MQGSPFLGSVPFFRATDRQIDMLVRSYEEIMVFSNHPRTFRFDFGKLHRAVHPYLITYQYRIL
jgi:hypothetical protein